MSKENADILEGFTGLTVDLDIKDGEWRKHITDPDVRHGRATRVGCLPNSTSRGKPTFQLLATMDDGTQVVIETTWALMRTATNALEVRWPIED